MDDLDRAKELEMKQRDAALQQALSKPDHSPGERQLMVNDDVVCIDCLDPINPLRLKIKPDVVRCVECKEVWERKYG